MGAENGISPGWPRKAVRGPALWCAPLVVLLVIAAPALADGPVYAEDPQGDAAPGPEPLANDASAADIVAFQVGPDEPTHLWFSLWLAKLPEPDSLPQEASYEVGGTLGGMTVTGRATWAADGWSYFLNAQGEGRTVGVRAQGAVDPDDKRIDIGVPRFHLLDPTAGTTMSDLGANARAGNDLVASCLLQACDEATTGDPFTFGNDTGTGLTFAFNSTLVRAGSTASWNGIATLTGPDTTFARSDPMVIDLGLRLPAGWTGTVEPARVSVQQEEMVQIAVTVDVPANATAVPPLEVVATDGDRRNTARLPVSFVAADRTSLPPADAPDADRVADTEDAPAGTFAMALLVALAAAGFHRRGWPRTTNSSGRRP